MRLLIALLFVSLVAAGCGGGGSSSSAPAAAPVGGFTLLVGDGPLDGVEEVNIVIDEVVLIGNGTQRTLTPNTTDPINLLDLRNVTELVVSEDVPTGSYSKVRLRISSMEIVESGGARELARLPANGKIDLNPQGPFEISAGEDLVVEIDLDLDRSVQVVQTGSDKYQFRPVVFIEVVDQTDNLRLSRVFGQLEQGDDDEWLLCKVGAAQDLSQCDLLTLSDSSLLLNANGEQVDVLPFGETVWVFGHFVVGVTGGESIRVQAIASGGETDLVQIDGSAGGPVENGELLPLLVGDAAEATQLQLVAGAKLLDGMGQPLSRDVAQGDLVEAWGQKVLVDAAADGDFPAFLAQVKADDTEQSVTGTLLSVAGDEISIDTPEGALCVIYTDDTDIQQVANDSEGAENMTLTLEALAELAVDGVQIEVFGQMEGDCLTADLILLTVE